MNDPKPLLGLFSFLLYFSFSAPQTTGFNDRFNDRSVESRDSNACVLSFECLFIIADKARARGKM